MSERVPVWPPSDEQIRAWLGEFHHATHADVLLNGSGDVIGSFNQELKREAVDFGVDLAFRLILAFLVVGGFLGVVLAGFGESVRLRLTGLVLLVVMVWSLVKAAELCRAMLPKRSRTRPPVGLTEGPLTTVAATDQDVAVTTRGVEQRGSWAELVGVEDHGAASVFRFADGEALRVPTVREFEPVLRAARHVVAARAAHEHAELARMEHGLSRPEGDAAAERGLSRLQ